MKNLFVWIHPDKIFSSWWEKATQIQIDNSLDLGWAREDIWLMTNFPYEYNGVKAMVLEDDTFYAPIPPVSKLNAVLKLFERGLIGDDLYWLHDIDAFQVNPFGEVDLGGCDMGVCNYGRMPLWAFGTVFFNKESLDIFQALKRCCYQYRKNEQQALWTVAGTSVDNDLVRHPMNRRVKLMNITYNFNTCNMRSNWKQAEKPLKVAHFHLTPRMMGYFLGEGSFGDATPDFITDRFRKYFL